MEKLEVDVFHPRLAPSHQKENNQPRSMLDTPRKSVGYDTISLSVAVIR
jgi:hypothetical protein